MEKQYINLCASLHFPEAGLALKVAVPETSEMDQMYKQAPDPATDPRGAAQEKSGAASDCWGKG